MISRTHRPRPGWRDRAARLHRIDPCAPTERDKLWAMETLREEAIRVQRWRSALPEDYGAYCVALAMLVARFRDPRAIDALALATSIAPDVPSALVAFGDAAVDALGRTMGVPHLRRSAAYTLRALLRSGTLGAEQALVVERLLTQ